MAPKKSPMPKSSLRKIPTFDTAPSELFKLWQEAGRIPSQYNSWEELKADFMSRIKEGQSAPEARKAMGVDYKNIIGNPILNVEKNKETGEISFAEGGMRRAIREDFNIAEENEIRRLYGQEEVNRFKAELQNDWNNLSEGERVAIQRQFNKQFHRGHVAGAKTGGSIARENMWPEHGMRNSLHGALPRWPVQVMEQLGVPKNWIGAYYEKVLASEGMPAAPRISDELAMAADERMVTPVSGRPSNIKGQTQWAPDIPVDARGKKWQPDLTNEAGIDPATLEMRSQRRAEAVAQFGEEVVRNYEANLSATMSRGTAEAQSGPVKIVQPPKGFTVTTKGVPKGLMPNRATLTAMAAGGIAALGPLGTAASAAETAGRTQIAQQTRDPADIAQAAIAGISSAADVASYVPVAAIPAEAVSTAADIANVAIDTIRSPKAQKTAVKTVQQASKLIPTVNKTINPVAAKITNEAQYFIVNPIRSAFDRVFGKREI